METSYDVRFRKTDVYKGRRTTTHWVRWTVAGEEFKEPFKTAGLARSFRSKLVTAAREGEAFHTSEGLPVSMLRAKRDMNWYDFACKYVDVTWDDAAGSSRRSTAQGLAAVTVALVAGRPNAPDSDVLRRALEKWAFSKRNRSDGGAPPDSSDALEWVRRNVPNVSSLADPEVLREVLGTLGRKLDGGRAAPNYFNRRRGVLSAALSYATSELKIFDKSPLEEIAASWADAKPARTTVDRRSVVNPAQAERLLAAVDQPRLKAFFGAMYYSALRPEEAVELREANLDLPEEGWGWINLDDAAPDVGGDWTDSGKRRDRREQLKHRGIGDGRSVPCPPEQTALFHWHLKEFGTDADGRLFYAVRRRGQVATTTYCKVWSRARVVALSPEQVVSPLGRKPYDLRHAAVSTWLNGGVDPAQVAEWAGHSKKVLLEVYAKCLDGREDVARQRIEAILRTAKQADSAGRQRRPTLDELEQAIEAGIGSGWTRFLLSIGLTSRVLAEALAAALPGLVETPDPPLAA